MIGSQFRIFMYSDSVQIKACGWSKASRRCPWRFLAYSKPNQPVLVQPSGASLWRSPDALQCLADYVEDVRTTEQHRPETRTIIIQYGVRFQKLTLFEKSLQVVRTMWQHVRTLSSISEFSNVPFECGNELYRRPSGCAAKLSGCGLDNDRIALFLKGNCRRPSEPKGLTLLLVNVRKVSDKTRTEVLMSKGTSWHRNWTCTLMNCFYTNFFPIL